MPGPTSQNIASAARSAATKLRPKAPAKKKLTSTTSTTKKKKKPSSADSELKSYLYSTPSSSSRETARNLLKQFKAPPASAIYTHPKAAPSYRKQNDEAAEELFVDASEMLDEFELDWEDELETPVHMPWSLLSNTASSPQRVEATKERKKRWCYKSNQDVSFDKLVKMFGRKLGPDSTIDLFVKLKADSGLKEYTMLLHMCVDKARDATDEDASLEQLYKIRQIFSMVQENGFKIQEEMYGKLLLYLIEFRMDQEFFFFKNLIIDENRESLTRLAYYEMLLWINVDNGDKIRELCLSAITDGSEEKAHIQENLLMALCKSDRKEELLMLLQALDITKFTSISCLQAVFCALGKFSLESVAEQSLQALKNSGADIGAVDISNFICEYAISIPNISVEDTMMTFQTLHAKLEALPTSAQYEKLIKYSLTLQKVHEALKITDEAFDSGISLSLGTYHSILEECIQSRELNLLKSPRTVALVGWRLAFLEVHQVNSMIIHHNLEPNHETFRLMIFLHVKMKDFEGAYAMINDLVKRKLKPLASIYNILLSGFFREKNISAARNVLKEMEDAGVKRDANTFSHLIMNSTREKDIIKFYEQMANAGVPISKQVFRALIHAYAACGEFEKAKEVVLDKRIPPKNLNEIKSTLIGVLASKGQLKAALELYEDMKKVECDVDPKAIRIIIDHFGPEGDLDKVLQLLEEIIHSPFWIDGCFKIISYCLKQENLRSALDLLKQLTDKFNHTEDDTDVIFDEVFYRVAEKTDTEFGLSLLKAVKEELGVTPSRKTLDFLLTGCVNAKDTEASLVIWKEYELAGFPYNVLSYLRMYQALLASGDRKSALKILDKIEKDDPHVRCVISAFAKTYRRVELFDKENKEKKKNKWKAGIISH